MRADDIVIPAGWEKSYERWRHAPAVRDGDLLLCSGFIGVDMVGGDGKVSPDPETQFRRAFEIVGTVLAAAGLSFADVVEMTTFHVGLREHWDTFGKVKDTFVQAPYPAWTAIGVTELAYPGALVEIKVTARFRVGGGDG
jgi:enamine deaminase RidA (YjgF/YER057c/UK114 family)